MNKSIRVLVLFTTLVFSYYITRMQIWYKQRFIHEKYSC
jgi:hypothetical protein